LSGAWVVSAAGPGGFLVAVVPVLRPLSEDADEAVGCSAWLRQRAVPGVGAAQAGT
jgi:hypothetical protein